LSRFRSASRKVRAASESNVRAASGVAIIIGVALKQASNDQTTVGSFVSFITAMLMKLMKDGKLKA
jgi:hypothetical protein